MILVDRAGGGLPVAREHGGQGALALLVVHEEVLDTSLDAVCLNSLDLGHHQPGLQQRVFAERLKRPAPHGNARDVHGRAQHDIMARG